MVTVRNSLRYREWETRCYETDRRKTKAENEILANQLPPGKWTSTFIAGLVRYAHPHVRMVVHSGPVVPDMDCLVRGLFARLQLT